MKKSSTNKTTNAEPILSSSRDSLREIITRRATPINMIPTLKAQAFDVNGFLAENKGIEGSNKASADALRGAVKFFFGNRTEVDAEPMLHPDVFSQIPPPVHSLIFWAELDILRREIKSSSFSLASSGLQLSLSASNDRPTACFHLRRAIEATWWGLYCTYGAEVCCTLLRNTLVQNRIRAASIASVHAENFIRGWFAPSRDSIDAGLRASDATYTHQHPGDFVEENDTITKKMRGVSRFWASQIETHHETKLVQYIDQTANAYDYLCKWVHLTPLAIASRVAVSFADPVSFVSLFRQTAISLFFLQRRLLFDERWEQTSFVRIVTPHLDPGATNAITIDLSVVEQLRHPRKSVEVRLDDGSVVAIFPK